MGTLDLLLKRMPRNTKTDKKSKKGKRRYSRGVKGIREYRKWVKHTGTINALAPVANMTRQIVRDYPGCSHYWQGVGWSPQRFGVLYARTFASLKEPFGTPEKGADHW